jgi:PAS domain S-box-containing protein
VKKSREVSERLRERAEQKRASLQERDLLGYLPPVEGESLIHELQVHQIELEMQNEELKRSQAELEESRGRYRDLYDFAPVGYLTLDVYGMIFEANLTAAAQLGISRGDAIGRHLHSFMDRESADALHLFLRKPARPGEKTVLECRLVRAQGPPAEFTLTAAGEYSHSGKPKRYRVILADVSKLKQMERQARETGERLRSLASQLNLAEEHGRMAIAQTLHDAISQTLAAARMKLSTALNTSVPPEKTVDEVLALLAAVLDESRSLMEEISPAVLHELGLGPSADWLADKMSRMHGISINTDKTGDFSDLGQDEKIMIYQMMRELLTNVVRHSGARNALLSLWRHAGAVGMSVWDDGRGFNAQKAGSAAGEGFGLFNISERMKACGGGMQIESAPGQGTTVTIRLPLAKK